MPKSTTQFVRMMAVLMLALSLLGMNAFAQSTTDGAIGGTVTDQTGAVIPNATVKATNTGTNRTATGTTDGSGRFRVVNLQPGTYALEISAGNFATYKAQGLIVEVGRVTSLEPKMSVSAQTEAVDVTGEAPVINTQSQDFTTNVNQTSMNELPINGRRWSQYALGTPGAAPDGSFGLVSFRGISGLLNNNTVDGGDNNNAFYGEERGRTRIGYVISQDAIQEFQVNTSNFSAEYGRAAGAVVNAVTKSGSNRFHGDGFWYFRHEALNAYNPFSLQSQLVGGAVKQVPIKPEDRRYQFGASVGGPIIKDKLFFFFSWDQQRRNFPGVAAPSSPSFFSPFLASELSTFTTRGITPAQQAAGLAYLVGLTGPVERRGDQLLLLPKIDWKVNDKHSVSLVYNRLRWFSPAGIQTQPVLNRDRTGWGNDGVKTDSGIGKVNSAITNSIANEFRFQYGRDFLYGSAQAYDPSEVNSVLGVPVGASIGNGGMTIGSPTYLPRDKNPVETRYQIADSVSYIRGKHQFKMGIDVNHVADDVDSIGTKFGLYNYSNRVDFISDFSGGKNCRGTVNGVANTPIPCYTNYQQAFGLQKFSFNTVDLAFYVQDDWRLSRRLTLSLGVRYERQLMPTPFLVNPAVPLTGQMPEDNDNFGPRVGFAWDVTGNGKTAIRGGYGVYYGRFLNSTISSALTNTGLPTGQLFYQLSPTTAAAGLYPTAFAAPPAIATSAPDVTFYSPKVGAPMIHQGDAVVEREIAKNTVISASYLWSHGTQLPAFLDRNLPTTSTVYNYVVSGGDYTGLRAPTKVYTGPRPSALFGRLLAISDDVHSDYNALALQFNRRMTGGLQVQANYTFSKATDNGQSSQTFTANGATALDPNCVGCEESPSNLDFRHRFNSSIVWQPQYFRGSSNRWLKGAFSGYTISPILVMSSGARYSGTVSGNAPGCGAGLTGVICSAAGSRTPFLERNSFQQPATYNVDLRLARKIQVKEYGSLEFLAEAFNLMNHVNVVGVNTQEFTAGGTVAVPTLTQSSTFALANASSATLSRERQFQFAVRFHF